MDGDGGAQTNHRDRRLRHRQSQSEQIRFRHTDYGKCLGVGIRTSLYECTVIHVATRDHTIEWSDDAGIVAHCAQLLLFSYGYTELILGLGERSLIRGDLRFSFLVLGLSVVEFL